MQKDLKSIPSTTGNTSGVFEVYQLWNYAGNIFQVDSKIYFLQTWKEEESSAYIYFSRNAQHLSVGAQISLYKI